MEKYHKPLGRLTGADLSALFDKLKEEDLIFRCSFAQIAKHFLGNFLPVNTFAADFTTLKESYVDIVKTDKKPALKIGDKEMLLEDDIPEKEQQFYKYICKKYLDLQKEPKEALLDAYEQAIQDFKEIDETLINIQSRLDEITKKNDPLEIQEEKPLLYYYQKHNQEAKDTILHFLKYDIKQYALSESYEQSFLSAFILRIPYNYRWNPKMYKPRTPNIFDNKFGELLLEEHRDLEKLYRNDRPAFNSYLAHYITEQDILFSITDLLHKHHVLAQRAETINEALFIYKQSAKIMFTSAAPTIIEGIFHDLCLMAGIPENELMQSSSGFQFKLDKLNDLLGLPLSYEYYSFQFRLLRNKVAHGRLSKTDVNEMADLMLLDLLHVCKLVFNTKFGLNQKLFLIDELYKTREKPEYKYLLEYILLDKVKIPSFYELDEKMKAVEALIEDESFWSFLAGEIDKGGEHIQHGIFSILIMLSKRNPAEQRTKALKKQIGLKKPKKELVDEFVKGLKYYY